MTNGAPYGWWVRVAQGGFVAAVGAYFAYRARHAAVPSWAVVPLALVSARLLADPDVLEYYWAGLAVTALCVVWSVRDRRPEWRAGSCLATFVLFTMSLTASGQLGSALELLLLLAVLTWCLALTRRSAGGAPVGAAEPGPGT
jgi:hypothetical protein